MKISSLKMKEKIALLLELFQINNIALTLQNKKYKNNYIRIINYHEIYKENAISFERHIAWYLDNFEDCNYKKFEQFLNKKYTFKNKPGLMITFDDGLAGNYFNAYPILKKYGFTGYYFVSTGLIGQDDYMNVGQLKEMICNNHIVGCHTYTHHRMNINDKNETLYKEILKSRLDLESLLGINISIFCWAGGEEKTYTKNAARYIRKSGYKYSMMTNSEPVTPNSNCYHLQRTNIDASWELSLVKFQLSGIIDMMYKGKRNRVNRITNI